MVAYATQQPAINNNYTPQVVAPFRSSAKFWPSDQYSDLHWFTVLVPVQRRDTDCNKNPRATTVYSRASESS